MQIRTFVLVALLGIASAQCGSGLQSCNGQCYNPSYNSCPTDSYTGKPVLCSLGYSSCAGACYQPSQYHCLSSGALAQGPASTVAAAKSTTASPVVTPTTSSVTPVKASTSSTTPKSSTIAATKAATTSSAAATKAATTSTVAATKAATTSSAAATTSSAAATPATSSAAACNPAGCGTGYCNCNGGCYQPSQYNCAIDSFTSKTVLCSGTLAACNSVCYDSTMYYCNNGSIAQGAPQPTTPYEEPIVNPTPAPAGPRPTQTADLRIINSCKSTLWFEARYGGNGAPIPGQSSTATQAFPGGYVDYTIPDTGLGGTRFWAKYGCDRNGKNCAIGDQMQYWPNPPGGCPANGCTPPVDSLFEATWGCRPGTGCNAQNPTTWFDTSQVDGWTIPYKLTPNGNTNGCDCVGSTCGFTGVDASTLDLANCPRTEDLSNGGAYPSVQSSGATIPLNSVDLRIVKNNQVLGCMSPCKRLNWGAPYGLGQDEGSGSTMWMCCPTPTPQSCSPANGCISPNACRAGPIENTKFVSAVHTMAPGVYSYSYDDGVGLHACPAGVVTYTMALGPYYLTPRYYCTQRPHGSTSVT